jgi:hypothetical protein
MEAISRSPAAKIPTRLGEHVDGQNEIREIGIHGANGNDRDATIDLGHGSADGGDYRGHVSRVAHMQTVAAGGTTQSPGEKNIVAALFRSQPGEFALRPHSAKGGIRHYADYFDGSLRSTQDEDPSERGAIQLKRVRQFAVDDGNSGLAGEIRGGEIAACEDRHAESMQVVGSGVSASARHWTLRPGRGDRQAPTAAVRRGGRAMVRAVKIRMAWSIREGKNHAAIQAPRRAAARERSAGAISGSSTMRRRLRR